MGSNGLWIPTLLLTMAWAVSSGCADGGGAADILDAVGPDLVNDPGPTPDEGPRDPGDGSDASTEDADADLGDSDALADAPDAWEPLEPPWVAPDDRLRLALDRRDMRMPMGLPTGGYGQGPPASSPKSPFADLFMATTSQLHPPRVQALHLLRSDRRLLLVQTDLIAPFWTLFQFLVQQVRARTGVDIADSLVLLANHTHLGPGRYLDTMMGVLFMDNYEEQAFQAVAGPIADALVAVLTAPAVPVEAKVATLTEGRIHKDRRCENPEYVNDAMGLLRFDTADETSPRTLALVINYALHGTVYGWASGQIGGDAPRSVELKVEEILPGPPMVMFTQSWAGDVAPTDPRSEFADAPGPEAQDKLLDQLEAIGRLAAETVLAGWDAFETMPDPVLDVLSFVAPTSWEELGYEPGEWDFRNGALLCGGGATNCTGVPVDMTQCLGMEPGWLPTHTRFTAWRLGDLAAVTLPGEPHTPLAEAVLDGMADAAASGNGAPTRAWVLGYGQDYTGYLMLEDDYAQGGYEGSMAFWGPRQGAWVVRNAVAVASRLVDPEAALPFVPTVTGSWRPGASTPHVPVASVAPGTVVADLPETAVAGDVLTFSWRGGDPLVDQPDVVVEESTDGTTFVPVVAGGRVVDQRDYRVILSLAVEPDWKKSAPGARTFTWTATLRTGVKVPAPRAFLEGTLRAHVKGRAVDEGGTTEGYDLASKPVDVAAAR